jgi:tRNA nucleotidyltransferase (CCA-adding enzyme)
MAAGRLIDPHGGQRDLKARLIRVLHDDSFRDDATRILRAVRYAGRLGFQIEPKTLRLLKRGLPHLRPISGARLRREIERIGDERRASDVLREAERLGVLAAVHPALAAGRDVVRVATGIAARADRADRNALVLCLLLAGATPRAAASAIARLSLTRKQADAVRGLLALRRLEQRLAAASLRPSAAVRLLEPFPDVSVEAFVLLSTNKVAARRARRYLEEWRAVRPFLDGRDIEALGVARGKGVGRALEMLRDARLDGSAKTRKDEEALVRKMTVRSSRRAVHA